MLSLAEREGVGGGLICALMKADNLRTAANFAAAGKKQCHLLSHQLIYPSYAYGEPFQYSSVPGPACRHCRAFTSPPKYERQETCQPVRSCLRSLEVIMKFLIVEIVGFDRAARTRLFMLINLDIRRCSAPPHRSLAAPLLIKIQENVITTSGREAGENITIETF